MQRALTDLVKKLLRVAARVLDVAPAGCPYRITPRGFATDARRLRADGANVARGLRQQLGSDQRAEASQPKKSPGRTGAQKRAQRRFSGRGRPR
jgi:uncharacterized protein (DUF924 family)